MSEKFLYYHNPRCSKSRQGLELITKKKVNFEVREYLSEKLTQKEVKDILFKLDIRPLDGFIRTKEAIFKELGLKGKELTDTQWSKLICENPKLLERPILVSTKKSKAAIGRPPEAILEIL